MQNSPGFQFCDILSAELKYELIRGLKCRIRFEEDRKVSEIEENSGAEEGNFYFNGF